ncbi:hypothetical protein CDD82_2580 [Ophiocordyceps australis]|uniref:Uncharacterized protein n=1 Tax=Ophiocordyceps australis TaxID=1399860 RepID=A0A2C5ZIU7_9HYPO|nr:hypothetical protein CDD82_2580 [Ophiocordyceps australis]
MPRAFVVYTGAATWSDELEEFMSSTRYRAYMFARGRNIAPPPEGRPQCRRAEGFHPGCPPTLAIMPRKSRVAPKKWRRERALRLTHTSTAYAYCMSCFRVTLKQLEAMKELPMEVPPLHCSYAHTASSRCDECNLSPGGSGHGRRQDRLCSHEPTEADNRRRLEEMMRISRVRMLALFVASRGEVDPVGCKHCQQHSPYPF